MSPPFLPEFELYVLLAVKQLGSNAYGAAIREEIDRRTGRPVSVGALYATLARLSEKGLLRQTVRAESQGRGRPRKYCALTARGESAVKHSAEMLHRMMDGLRLAPEER